MIEDIEFKPVLEKASSRGGQFAELFVEERVQTEIVLEAGILERASFGILRGAGVRLISDFRTRYAFTNSLLKDDLQMLASKVAESVDQGAQVIEIPLEYKCAMPRPRSARSKTRPTRSPSRPRSKCCAGPRPRRANTARPWSRSGSAILI